MTREWMTKSFKSGNSVALRVPASVGIHVGEQFRLVEDGEGFRLERMVDSKRKFDVDKIWGIAPGLAPVRSEDRVFDPSPRIWDDPDWPGFRVDPDS